MYIKCNFSCFLFHNASIGMFNDEANLYFIRSARSSVVASRKGH